MKTYIFLIRFKRNFDIVEPSVDCFYEMPNYFSLDSTSFQVAMKMVEATNQKELSTLRHVVTGMQLRARFNNDIENQIFIVKCEEEITSDILDQIIKQKSNEGVLQDFLQGSEIRI